MVEKHFQQVSKHFNLVIIPQDMKAVSSILKIYPSGMTSDTPVSPVLAWEVKMTSESVRSMD